MAIIQGSQVTKFTDRSIDVSIILNKQDKEAKEINENKFQPIMLDNTYRLSGMAFIGKACVVPKDAPLDFRVSSSSGICGLKAYLSTAKEKIFNGGDNEIFFCTANRYSLRPASLRRYTAEPKLIVVSDFSEFSKEEGFSRSNLTISANEILSYTENGVNYPTAGVDANVVPGSVNQGGGSSQKWGESVSNTTIGKELGAMLIYMFVVKDVQSYYNLVQQVPGLSSADEW